MHVESHVGPVAGRELLELYQRAGILVFGTTGDGFPLTALEAMTAGTPVLAPESSPIGYFVDKHDLGETFITNNPESSENLRWENIARSYETIYSQVAGLPEIADARCNG